MDAEGGPGGPALAAGAAAARSGGADDDDERTGLLPRGSLGVSTHAAGQDTTEGMAVRRLQNQSYSSFYGTLFEEEEGEVALDAGHGGEGWRQRLCHCLGDAFIKTCAIGIAVFITVIDNLPYGLLIFPPAFNLSPLGVQMVLVSAVVSQAVYGAMSTFTCALGSFIIENVAFLRAMSTSLSSQLRADDRLEHAFMTILFCFSLSTVLTGVAFYVLGVLQLGKISSFVPQHVLLGCISGMGTFIFAEAIGISTGVDWSWEPAVLLQQLQPAALAKITVTGVLTAGLSLLKTKITHPVLTPIYFFIIPAAFFGILHLFHIPLESARESGWLFSFTTPDQAHAGPAAEDTTGGGAAAASVAGQSSIGVMQECRSFPGILACLDPRMIAWDLVPTQLFTILGIVFFSIIHVPVNVPALAATTGVDADLNQELKAHGLSNVLSGLLGGLQNYMAYSMSALYYKTGGEGRLCAFVVAALLGGFMALGPETINYFPRPLAGCLLLHLGAILLYESLFETWRKAVDLSEYATIVVINLSMTVIGFMEGVGIGLLLACGTFVVQCSRINPIGAGFPGDGLSSKEMRSMAQRKLLDYRLQGSIYIVRLRGHLFFGNSEQLWLFVREVLVRMPGLKFLIIDTAELVGLDFSARERLAMLCRTVTSRRIHLVWAGLHKDLRQKLKAGGCFEPVAASNGASPGTSMKRRSTTTNSGSSGSVAGLGMDGGAGPGRSPLQHHHATTRFHHFAKDLNKAFTFCEDAVLESLNAQDREGESPQGTGFLHRTLKKLTSEPDEIIARIVPFFAREVVPAGMTLWRRNDPSSFACIVQKGLLGVPRSPNDPSISASLAQAPASIGYRTTGGGGSSGGSSGGPPQPAPPAAPAAVSASSASVSVHHPLFLHVEPDSLSYSRGRSGSIGSSAHHAAGVGLGLGCGPHGGGGAHGADYIEYSLPGQMSGELGLFTKELRRYTMVAVTETVLWRVDLASLQAMLQRDPAAYIVLQKVALSYASHRLHCLVLQGQLHSV